MENHSTKLKIEPFLCNELKILARFLVEGEDFDSLKKRKIEENLMQDKNISSVKITNTLIFVRLKVMNKLENFVFSYIENSKYILLYVIIKTNEVVRDLVTEVYKENLLMRKDHIEKFDIDNNLHEKKCILSDTLKNITESKTFKIK